MTPPEDLRALRRYWRNCQERRHLRRMFPDATKKRMQELERTALWMALKHRKAGSDYIAAVLALLDVDHKFELSIGDMAAGSKLGPGAV